MQRGEMDDDRTKAEFARIEEIAKLDKEREIITQWERVGEARYRLGRAEKKLGVKE